jgi:nitroreductase
VVEIFMLKREVHLMEVFEAIYGRRSIRGFRPDPVPARLLDEIVDAGRWAPSSQNIQPWELVLLGGDVFTELKARLTEKLELKDPPNLDIPSPDYPEKYSRRAADNRERIDSYQFPPGTNDLQQKRDEFWVKGGRFHDAPNAILVCMEKVLLPHYLLEAGLIIQTICLAAHARGLGTCIMRRPIWWPDLIREALGIPPSKIMVISIAIGYPDTSARVNGYTHNRVPVADIMFRRGV